MKKIISITGGTPPDILSILLTITLLIITLFLLIAGVLGIYKILKEAQVKVAGFEECVAKEYLILESYPRQCKTPQGQTFTEDIGNALEKQNLIRVSQPRPNDLIKSPLEIKGEARGFWFFEASFPVKLFDSNGKELKINPSYAQAKGDWMTENFVPFEAKIEFENPTTKKGTLVLEKDNPSDLPQNADQLTVPVRFAQ